jgi:hypothetical protein
MLAANHAAARPGTFSRNIPRNRLSISRPAEGALVGVLPPTCTAATGRKPRLLISPSQRQLSRRGTVLRACCAKYRNPTGPEEPRRPCRTAGRSSQLCGRILPSSNDVSQSRILLHPSQERRQRRCACLHSGTRVSDMPVPSYKGYVGGLRYQSSWKVERKRRLALLVETVGVAGPLQR